MTCHPCSRIQHEDCDTGRCSHRRIAQGFTCACDVPAERERVRAAILKLRDDVSRVTDDDTSAALVPETS